ncbi:hypothetical protein ZWY2020_004445 [Hordeum vulgare]|nr:hypothetical protein ZWY2020_004445 [Hordeum vulgare]
MPNCVSSGVSYGGFADEDNDRVRTSNGRGTRETTPCSLIYSSKTMSTPSSATRASNPSRRTLQTPVCRYVPSSLEMDEFFATDEQQQHQHQTFRDKYNFCPASERPLPSRSFNLNSSSSTGRRAAAVRADELHLRQGRSSRTGAWAGEKEQHGLAREIEEEARELLVHRIVEAGTSVALFKKNGKYEYSHINFWATPKGSNFSAPGPVLFFAQCSNGDKDEDERPSMCVPVSGSWISDVCCFNCERKGIKIVHPYNETYHGRDEDFLAMARGDHSICNEDLISSCEFHAYLMCTLKEDWIFFDPNMDATIADKNPIDDYARAMKRWKNRIF